MPVFTQLPTKYQPVEKVDPTTFMGAEPDSRGSKSGFRAPKQAFLNPIRIGSSNGGFSTA